MCKTPWPVRYFCSCPWLFLFASACKVISWDRPEEQVRAHRPTLPEVPGVTHTPQTLSLRVSSGKVFSHCSHTRSVCQRHCSQPFNVKRSRQQPREGAQGSQLKRTLQAPASAQGEVWRGRVCVTRARAAAPVLCSIWCPWGSFCLKEIFIAL